MNVDEGVGTVGYFVTHEHGTYAALVIDSETRPVDFVYKQACSHFQLSVSGSAEGRHDVV